MLARWRIGTKLLLAPALMLSLLIVASGSAWWAMSRQHAMLENIVDVRAARIREVTALAASVQAAHARSYQLLTWVSASMSAPRIAGLVQDIHTRQEAIVLGFARLQAARPPAEQALVGQGGAAWQRYVRAVEDVLEMASGDQSLAASAMVKAEHNFAEVAQQLDQLSQREQALAETASRSAADDVAAMAVWMPLLVALSVILSLAISVAVRRSLLAEVRAIADAALDLASGNLAVRARDYGSDEIAQTSRVLDQSIRNLNGTLKGIIESASALDQASQASGAMVEKLAQVVVARGAPAAGGVDERLLDLPDACAIVETREMSPQHCALVNEAAAVAAALQGQASSLSQAVAGFRLDDAAALKPVVRGHLRLAAQRPAKPPAP